MKMTARTIALLSMVLAFPVFATAQSPRAVEASANDLVLRHLCFDPLVEQPDVALASSENERLWIVQFVGPVRAEWTALLRALGVKPLSFFPHRAQLVDLRSARVADLFRLDFVRAVSPYHPSWRLGSPELLRKRGRLRVNVLTVENELSTKTEFLFRLRKLGGRCVAPALPKSRRLVCEFDARALDFVLADPAVLFVDAWGPLEADMDQVRMATGATTLETVEGFTGAGVRGQVRDFGLDLSHPEIVAAAPVLHNGVSGSIFHGTSVYAITFGPGINPMARGMLPDGQGVFTSESTTFDRYLETSELLTDPFRCVFETNSVGSPLTTDYTTVSADMDDILFDLDLLIFQSQSNSGTQASRPEAWAKNIVSVGGILGGNDASDANDTWSGNASIGPASDGRQKPDLASYANFVFTASPTIGYLQAFGGTSAAAPITAGVGGLFHQMWSEGIFGNALSSWDVFDNRPSMTLAKAMLLNAARAYDFAGPMDDLARNHQGWGQPDALQIHDQKDQLVFVDESVVLTQGQSHVLSLTVEPGTPRLRATLVFADPAGNPAAGIHRVNDFDLEVVAPDGTLYRGNHGLQQSNDSTPGGSADTVDTVEQVWVSNPASGSWTIRVIASEINADGHVETAALDGDFSLVVSGVAPLLAPPADSGQANQAEASMRIVDSVNANGFLPEVGVAGPFFIERAVGSLFEMIVEGPVNSSFAIAFGPLNRSNADFGGFGQLDIGLLGASDLSDLTLLIDGISPLTFFDFLGTTGPNGRQDVSLSLPNFPPGVFAAFQAVVLDSATGMPHLSAATEVSIP